MLFKEKRAAGRQSVPVRPDILLPETQPKPVTDLQPVNIGLGVYVFSFLAGFCEIPERFGEKFDMIAEIK